MNIYRVYDRKIDDEVINVINKLPDLTIVELKNTKGQDAESFSKITSKVLIRVIGPYYKDKYNSEKYFYRTLYTKEEMVKIIKDMENIEKNIDPSWNDLEKAMYVYKTLVESLTYKKEDDKNREYTRNLLVLLNNSGVCAGFSLVFKEIMDRINVKCLYQSKKGGHAWNLIFINNKYYPVDLTCDILNYLETGVCKFKMFGNYENFFNDEEHKTNDEIITKGNTFSTFELEKSYNTIINGNKNNSNTR